MLHMIKSPQLNLDLVAIRLQCINMLDNNLLLWANSLPFNFNVFVYFLSRNFLNLSNLVKKLSLMLPNSSILSRHLFDKILIHSDISVFLTKVSISNE